MMTVSGRHSLCCFLFFIVLFILTRQVPFSSYSFISNIAIIILLLLLINSNRNSIVSISYISLWLSVLFIYSLFSGNEATLIIHFMIAIILLLSSNFAQNIPKIFLQIFFILVTLQSLFLIFMELVLNIFYTPSSYLILREIFIDKGWGDLYTYNDFFYRIQVKGNALIPFAFFLTFIKEVKFSLKYNKFHRFIAFAGICIAGNFAFWISTFIFLVGYSIFFGKNRILNAIIVLITVILAAGYIFHYVTDVLSRKVDSLGTRGDQFFVLISGLTDNINHFTFGNGLGSTLSVRTSFRDYTGDIYFELQGVYYIYQLGILNSLIFFGLMFYLAFKKIFYKDLLFIYIVYLTYAVSNPYFLDTNHIVLIIVLRLIYEFRKENRMYNSSI